MAVSSSSDARASSTIRIFGMTVVFPVEQRDREVDQHLDHVFVERSGASVKEFRGIGHARDDDGAGAAGAFVGLLDERGAHAGAMCRFQRCLLPGDVIGVCTPMT
jgi:hypothetical protein